MVVSLSDSETSGLGSSPGQRSLTVRLSTQVNTSIPSNLIFVGNPAMD